MAKKVVADRGVCIRVACVAFRISESCYRYERKLDAENDEVANWLIRLFNLVTLNKTLMLNGLIVRCGMNGCHSTIG